MPQDLLNRIISDLQQLSQQVGDVSDIEERQARAKADLDSLNQARENALAQKNEAETLLSQAQKEAQRRFDTDMFNKQGQLKSLVERIKTLEQRAKELIDDVAAKESQLAAASSSMEDMRRKLAS